MNVSQLLNDIKAADEYVNFSVNFLGRIANCGPDFG